MESSKTHGRAHVLVGAILQAMLVVGLATNAGAQQWVASWGSSLHGLSPEDATITNATIRLVARSTIAGDRVRMRIENTYGEQPLTIGAASVGLRNRGPSLVIGSSRVLHFGGAAAVTIPAGEYIVSDPLSWRCRPSRSWRSACTCPGPMCAAASTATRSLRHI